MDTNEIIELLKKDILSCKRNVNDRIDNIADVDYAIATLNTLKEAINYTRCCATLKDKEETTFELWLKNFKKTEYGYWFDKRTVYCYEAMKDIYKTSVKPNL